MIWRDFILRPVAVAGVILCTLWMVTADTRCERGWFLFSAVGWGIILRQGYYWGPETRRVRRSRKRSNK